jgi:hypothetical protein
MSLIKALYIVAIGLLIAAFVGFGVETFYASPKMPDYPNVDYRQNGTPTDEGKSRLDAYEKEQKDFQKVSSTHNQNTSIILIVISVILLAASIVGLSKLEIIGDGVTLGGVFTLFYGITRAISTQEAVFRFIAVGIALAIVVGLTYWRFLRHQVSKS